MIAQPISEMPAVLWTTAGMLERRVLTYRESVEWEDTMTRIFAREWYFEGRMVRRDSWVQFKRGLHVGAAHGGLG